MALFTLPLGHIRASNRPGASQKGGRHKGVDDKGRIEIPDVYSKLAANEPAPRFDPFRHRRMTAAQFGAERRVRENHAVLAIQRPSRRQGGWNDVDLKRHAGSDALGRALADRGVDPLVVASQVPRIEGRAQAASSQRFRHRREHVVASRAEVRRLVPSNEAREIGGRHFQERVVMLRDQPGAGGEAAPEADRSRRAIAAAHDPAAGRAQADHVMARVAGRVHDMGAQNLAGVAHDARRLQFADADPRSRDNAPDRGRSARGAPLVQRNLIGVDRRAKALRRVHQHGRRVGEHLRPARDPAQHRDETVGNKESGRRLVPFRRLEIFPPDEADRLPASQACVSQHSREIGRARAVLAHQAHALRERRLDARKAGERRVGLALVSDHQDPPVARAEQQQRLLEPRLVAAKERYIGEMFAVGVDDEPIACGSRIGLAAARFVGGSGNAGRIERHAEGGDGDLAQRYRHKFLPPSRPWAPGGRPVAYAAF